MEEGEIAGDCGNDTGVVAVPRYTNNSVIADRRGSCAKRVSTATTAVERVIRVFTLAELGQAAREGGFTRTGATLALAPAFTRQEGDPRGSTRPEDLVYSFVTVRGSENRALLGQVASRSTD